MFPFCVFGSFLCTVPVTAAVVFTRMLSLGIYGSTTSTAQLQSASALEYLVPYSSFRMYQKQLHQQHVHCCINKHTNWAHNLHWRVDKQKGKHKNENIIPGTLQNKTLQIIKGCPVSNSRPTYMPIKRYLHAHQNTAVQTGIPTGGTTSMGM